MGLLTILAECELFASFQKVEIRTFLCRCKVIAGKGDEKSTIH